MILHNDIQFRYRNLANAFASMNSNTMTATPQTDNERNEVSFSNEKIGSGRGKPSSDIHRNSQSDRQGCLHDSVIFDGKPSGEKFQETVLVQTQVVAHASGPPGEEPSGSHLNSSGKPNGNIHSTGLPMLVDPTPFENIIENNNNIRQRVENDFASLTSLKQYMQTRREELIPQVYQCYIEEKDFSNKSNDPECKQYIYKMQSTMKSEKKAVEVMNKKLTDLGQLSL